MPVKFTDNKNINISEKCKVMQSIYLKLQNNVFYRILLKI